MTRERRRQDGTPASLAIGRSCGAARVDALLAGQAAYYSARAPEYDDDAYPGSVELAFAAILDRFDPAGDVLELACGTGHWTPGLLRHARTVTAVDASAEMLAIAPPGSLAAATMWSSSASGCPMCLRPASVPSGRLSPAASGQAGGCCSLTTPGADAMRTSRAGRPGPCCAGSTTAAPTR